MRILYPAAYFHPENTAFSHLEKDLLQTLTDAGHEVEVVCPTPTRGVGDEVWREYRRRKEETLYGGRVRVRRFWAPREGKNPLIRAFRYFWCAFRTVRVGRRARGIDVILAVSTPPIQGLAAGWLKKILGCSAVYMVQDLFPESLASTGLSRRGSLLWRIGDWVAEHTYTQMDRLAVISRTFRSALLERGVPDEKIDVIYNWVDTEAVFPVPKADNPLYEACGLDRTRFTVLYAGNLGESQNGGLILDAAALLRKEREIGFVIFGGGSGYEPLRRRAEREGLENVRFYPLLPQERAGEVYSLGDAALITCKPGTGRAGMPSKLWSILAAGTPVIASFDLDSELASVIEEADCGVTVDPADPQALADAVLAAFRERERLAEQGRNGRAYAAAHGGKAAAVTAYLRVLEKAVCRGENGKAD